MWFYREYQLIRREDQISRSNLDGGLCRRLYLQFHANMEKYNFACLWLTRRKYIEGHFPRFSCNLSVVFAIKRTTKLTWLLIRVKPLDQCILSQRRFLGSHKESSIMYCTLISMITSIHYRWKVSVSIRKKLRLTYSL